MKTTLIRNGTVVLPGIISQQDLLIRGEKIAAVGDLSGLAADETVDATDLLVLPGGVDTHVHFNDVFMNTISVHDYYIGTVAAAFGGTTSVIDFSKGVFHFSKKLGRQRQSAVVTLRISKRLSVIDNFRFRLANRWQMRSRCPIKNIGWPVTIV